MEAKDLCRVCILVLAGLNFLNTISKPEKKRVLISVFTYFFLTISWMWAIFILDETKWVALILCIIHLFMFIIRFLYFLMIKNESDMKKEECDWKENASFILEKVSQIKYNLHVLNIKLSEECLKKLDELYDVYAQKRITYQTSLKIKDVIQKFASVVEEYQNLQPRLETDEKYFNEAVLDFEDFIFKIELYEFAKASTFESAVADFQSSIVKSNNE